MTRAGGDEALLTPPPDHDRTLTAARKALSRFTSLAPLSPGPGSDPLAKEQSLGAVLALYLDAPVDFHLPFSDRGPDSLMIVLKGAEWDRDCVFRGSDGGWWGVQICMHDPQPLVDALTALRYIAL